MPIDWASIGSDLSNAGGWAVVVTLGAAILVGAVKGWWVPGFVYRREVERGDGATAESRQVATSLDRLTSEIRDRGIAGRREHS